MATGILDSSSKNLSMLDKRFEERKNSVDRVHERFYNLRMDRQAQINAFNQKIAQANAQTNLASFFQQQQLMNKRAADLEAARAAYQQHYEQYGGTLNESALRFLDQHAKIDVPTFTSIMAGYEHAKASAAQRDKERIDTQVEMAEKMGALDKERAASLEKALQAELAPRIQALENEKALLAAQQDENDKYRKQLDALYDKRFDAEIKMLLAGMRGSGTGRGIVGGRDAFNAANKQGSGDDFAKRIAEAYGPNSGYIEAEIPEFSRFIQNDPIYDAYTRTPRNQIVINYLTDYENGFAYKSLEKTDKELYNALEKKKKEYIKENSATRDISLEDRAAAQNLQTQGDPAFSDKDFQGKHLGIGTSENYLGKLFEAAVDSMLLAGYSKEVSAFAHSNKNIDTQSSDFGVINIANKLDAVARAKNPSIGKSGKLTDEEVKNLLPANNMNIAAAIADRQIRPVFNMKALTNEKLYEDIMYSKTPEEFGNNWAKAFPDNKNNPNYVTIEGYNERAAENNRKYRASQEYNKLIKEGDEIGAENVMRRFFGMPEKVPQIQAQTQLGEGWIDENGRVKWTGNNANVMSVRTNNPLNLNKINSLREGELNISDITGSPRERVQAIFSTPQAGLNAAAKDIIVHKIGKGIDTPLALINKWAPPSDGNDTSGYANRVSVAMGISPDDRIDWNNEDMMFNLIRTMVDVEGGAGTSQIYGDEMIRNAVRYGQNALRERNGQQPVVQQQQSTAPWLVSNSDRPW